MKKIIVPILACMLTSGIYAQKAVEGVKFTDNWSVGVNAGEPVRLLTVHFLEICVPHGASGWVNRSRLCSD